MLSEEEFKKDYAEYAKRNRLDCDDKILNKKYKEYKSNTGDYSDKPEPAVKKERSKINIQISEALEKIKELRIIKKEQGTNFNRKSELKELLKEIEELRMIKKNGN